MSNLDTFHMLSRELRCPDCKKYMNEHIYQCSSGHSICKRCRPVLKGCPTCKEDVLPRRNFTLEKLAAGVLEPCPFTARGCDESFFREDIKLHEPICIYASQPCPYKVVCDSACDWKGSYEEMEKHIMRCHNMPGDECSVKSGCLKSSLDNFRGQDNFTKVIVTLDKVFLIRFMKMGINFFCSALYVGPHDEVKRYKYKFSISHKEVGTISYCLEPKHYLDEFENVLDYGYAVSIYLNCVNSFVEKGALKYEIEFFEIDEEDEEYEEYEDGSDDRPTKRSKLEKSESDKKETEILPTSL